MQESQNKTKTMPSDFGDADVSTFAHVASQYRAMVMTSKISWKNLFCILQTETNQEKLIHSTIGNAHTTKYPPSRTYRWAFLKYIISKLEEEGIEVCDAIYEASATLINEVDNGDSCYKTYTLKSGTLVTIRETVQTISKGTTGLSTWPAAQYLAEWALENPEVFSKRRVLELGSGLGLTGLSIYKTCQPSSFTFSDCHSAVIASLKSNILTNLEDMPKVDEKLSTNEDISHRLTKCGTCEIVHDLLKSNKQVSVMDLDWGDTDSWVLEHMNPDIIIAADVVYDVSIVPNLVNVIKKLLLNKHSTHHPEAYIASTVRNEDTRNAFLECLESADLKFEKIAGPQEEVFFYDRSVAIELLHIRPV
ncbi:unnamed protein product [Owenia fusiformis]|uniref:FAM86 N-terminal domain-containing protein n=1 Tax=Owenia fusiformis TaxID=6347 RepID=A0A8J1UQ00_OWEFU|nr:unnamed protein product [Owenia fusiformis]